MVIFVFLTEMKNKEEFVAHSGSVNCLKIGKKNFRQFITGGDDQVVNIWSIGKPEPVTVSSRFSLYNCSCTRLSIFVAW